jgi:hypothetical protein
VLSRFEQNGFSAEHRPLVLTASGLTTGISRARSPRTIN